MEHKCCLSRICQWGFEIIGPGFREIRSFLNVRQLPLASIGRRRMSETAIQSDYVNAVGIDKAMAVQTHC